MDFLLAVCHQYIDIEAAAAAAAAAGVVVRLALDIRWPIIAGSCLILQLFTCDYNRRLFPFPPPPHRTSRHWSLRKQPTPSSFSSVSSTHNSSTQLISNLSLFHQSLLCESIFLLTHRPIHAHPTFLLSLWSTDDRKKKNDEASPTLLPLCHLVQQKCYGLEWSAVKALESAETADHLYYFANKNSHAFPPTHSLPPLGQSVVKISYSPSSTIQLGHQIRLSIINHCAKTEVEDISILFLTVIIEKIIIVTTTTTTAAATTTTIIQHFDAVAFSGTFAAPLPEFEERSLLHCIV